MLILQLFKCLIFRYVIGNCETIEKKFLCLRGERCYMNKKKCMLVVTMIMLGAMLGISGVLGKAKMNAKVSSRVDVRSYGAVGDGITDDTEAIAKAMKENVGRDIYFPTGIYVISEKINIYSDTSIMGDGVGSKIIAASGKASGTEIFQIYGEKNISISNICVSGNSQVNNGEQHSDQDGIHLLDMWNVKDITIEECYFIDNIYCAIRIFGGENITVSNTKILNVDCGVSAIGKNNVKNLIVNNCYFKGHYRSEAISLYGSGVYENIYIYSNVIEDKTSGHGIMFNNQSVNKKIYIRDNIISNCAVAISAFNIIEGEVIGNVVSGTTSGRGMEIYNCDNVLVDNNIVSNTNFDSLSIKACSKSIFNNNFIMITSNAKNANMAGIKILEENKEVTIFNNTVKQVEKSLNKFSIYIKGYGNVKIYENQLNGLPIYKSQDSFGIDIMSND